METAPYSGSLPGVLPPLPLADLAPGAWWLVAQAEFPRGPGFYYSLVKLAFLLATFLIWVYICNAVQKDSDEVDFSAPRSNAFLLGAGALGLAVVWFCPNLWMSLLGMAILVACAVVAYGLERDSYAPVSWLQPLKKALQKLLGSDS